MSLRVDTSSLIAGALVCGNRGLGVLGAEVPSTGDSGAGYLYNDLSLPADANKEVCGRITSWPSTGDLFAYEDTSFEFSGAPDGSYTFDYQLYVDGVATGSPETVYLQVGPYLITAANSQQVNQASTGAVASAGTIAIAGSNSVQANTASVGTISQTHLIGASDAVQANTATPGSIALDGVNYIVGSNSAQANQVVAGAIAQTHLIACANSQQQNRASAASTGEPVAFILPAARATRTASTARRPAALSTSRR